MCRAAGPSRPRRVDARLGSHVDQAGHWPRRRHRPAGAQVARDDREVGQRRPALPGHRNTPQDPGDLNARWIHDFDVSNRVEGDGFNFTASFKF